VTPIDPEDAFALSRGVDWILNHAGVLISEAQVMDVRPDAALGRMGALLVDAVRRVDEAVSHLASDADEATRAADEAIEIERELERAYYEGMAALLEVKDMRERISRRELYRRFSQIGEDLVDVAERVVYAVVKES
jgi:uncharacterized protein Yka (UPF0111/DUF47 family)